MRTRADQTAVRAVEEQMRKAGHKFPAFAAQLAVEPGQGTCRHPRTYEVIQTSLLGGEELQKICARCGSIVSYEVAA